MTKKELLLKKIDNIFIQTQMVIDGIALGNRMQLKEMAEAVSAAMGLDTKSVALYVSEYAHNAEGGYVTRGKKGGFIKGDKPVKVLKPTVIPTPPSPALNKDSN